MLERWSVVYDAGSAWPSADRLLAPLFVLLVAALSYGWQARHPSPRVLRHFSREGWARSVRQRLLVFGAFVVVLWGVTIVDVGLLRRAAADDAGERIEGRVEGLAAPGEAITSGGRRVRLTSCLGESVDERLRGAFVGVSAARVRVVELGGAELRGARGDERGVSRGRGHRRTATTCRSAGRWNGCRVRSCVSPSSSPRS